MGPEANVSEGWPKPRLASDPPEEGAEILAFNDDDFTRRAWIQAVYVNGEWVDPFALGIKLSNVTYWLPLPPPPEEL